MIVLFSIGFDGRTVNAILLFRKAVLPGFVSIC